MPVNYTNRKGLSYTLYRGQTKTGKPRYYFGRTDQSHDQGEPVTELPPGFTISESVNGVVSLVKERQSLILPEEAAVIETELKHHPKGRRYKAVVKHDYIEIYEQNSPDSDELTSIFRGSGFWQPDLTSKLQAQQERYTSYSPVFRFTLHDPAQRLFGAKRMCYRSSVDGWLTLIEMGSLEKLAARLIPTLGTDEFFELY